MPEALRKAHNQLDKAVDAAYGYKPNVKKPKGLSTNADESALRLRSGNETEGRTLSDTEVRALSEVEGDTVRVAYLFELYQQQLSS